MSEYAEKIESILLSVRRELTLESPLTERKNYIESFCICLSGDYRSFDFCKYSLEYSILSQMQNYDVYCLLSDENYTENQIAEQKRKLSDFFGSHLKYCEGFSSLNNEIQEKENQLHEEYMKVCPHPNLRFNIKAQYRRYILNCIKNSFNIDYDYTVIARFDIFYSDVVNILLNSNGSYGTNDMLFICKNVNLVLEDVGIRYLSISLNNPGVSILNRYAPEFIYCVSMKQRNIEHKNTILCLRVRNFAQGESFANIDNKFYICLYNFKNFPGDFNWKIYREINGFEMNEIESKYHFYFSGRKEGRKYRKCDVEELPEDFDCEIYRCLYPDLSNKTDFELRGHYRTSGKREGRRYKLPEISNFNPWEYIYLNKDLSSKNKTELKIHYLVHGKKEGRRYLISEEDFLNLPSDFDWQRYISFYSDLRNMNERNAKVHYLIHGSVEKRRYK